jgi:hypothetical protein
VDVVDATVIVRSCARARVEQIRNVPIATILFTRRTHAPKRPHQAGSVAGPPLDGGGQVWGTFSVGRTLAYSCGANYARPTLVRQLSSQSHQPPPHDRHAARDGDGDHLTAAPCLRARCPHSLQFGRYVLLSLPYEALLMCLEVGDTLFDLIALGYPPIHEGHSVWFDDRLRWHCRYDAKPEPFGRRQFRCLP